MASIGEAGKKDVRLAVGADDGTFGYGDGGAWGGWRGGRTVNVRAAIEPLLARLREYDGNRRKLEKEGGVIAEINRITELLTQTFPLSGRYRDHTVSLVNPPSLRSALIDIGNDDLHLDVRQLSTRMPVYYLCRIRWDYWSAYSLVVEDVYRSPGYPILDERFVRLMDAGHETYYLRLSPFRAPVAGLAGGEPDRLEWAVDDILSIVGRHVLQAAWHDDQRPGMLTAAHFGLPHFRQAIELLYLCLSGDLCELRNAVNGNMTAFFRDVYPQPAILTFLTRLAAVDGGAISEIPQSALKLYARLTRHFGQFLGSEVAWGRLHGRVPLYKLVFGNFPRLDLVGAGLRSDPRVQDAVRRLERESQAVIGEIVG